MCFSFKKLKKGKEKLKTSTMGPKKTFGIEKTF
jgi:hypothetical protein